METTKQSVCGWMRGNAHEYLDGCGDINCTALAEAACQHFDAYGPPPTYDAPEEYFDWAIEIETWYFNHKEKAI